MPLIGEELRTILGMMPRRDRAGIARGTMADDAVAASAQAESGNAEGQALMQQGQRPPMPTPPPQIKLPPMGGPGGPPPGDIQLPANVPTAYASGGGGGGGAPALPAPQERVVAASPAAAPSRTVGAKASEVMVAALEQQARQQKMMQLVGSLGLMANSIFNRNPQSQAATKNSLADMIGGGGGGKGGANDLATIKTVADMQRQEETDAAAAQARTSAIGAMVRRGMSPAEAAVEYDSGQYKDRFGAEAEEKAKTRKEVDERKKKLLTMAPEIAKARGTDVRIIESMIDKDPDAVAKLAEAEGLTELTIKQNTATKGTIENATELQELKAWKDNLDKLIAGGATPEEIASHARSPSAMKLGFAEQAKRAATLDDASREKLFTHHVDKERPEGDAAATYLTSTAKAIGDIWHPNITTGTLSNLRQSIARAYATATGGPTPDLNDTAAINSLLKASAVEGLKAIGGNDSNADLLHASAIKGSTELGPVELRSVAVLNEKAARAKVEKTNAQRDAYMARNPAMRSKFDNLPEIKMPEPSKLLMADIYHPDPSLKERNAQLRSRLEAYHQQAMANPDETTINQYKEVERRFNAEYGAGTAEHYMKEQAAKKGS